MLFRLLAVVGLPAHLISRFSGFMLGLVGIRLPVVALLAGGLGLLAGLEAWGNYEELTERPEPRQATVAEVVEETERRQVIWLTFTGAIAAEPFVREVPVLGSGVHELGRRVYFYYLALDPEDPDVGLIVRSQVDDDHFRTRSLTARMVEDAEFVETALGRLAPLAGVQIDGARYLEELAESEPAEDELTPGELTAVEAGSELTVTGRIPAPARMAACAPPGEEAGCHPDDPTARWVYVLADPAGDTAFVLLSSHAPDAIPADLDGMVLTDTFRTAPVIESDWLAEVRDDLRYPQSRVLFHGAAPPFRDPDWSGVIVMAGVALFLLISLVVGYPIFRRTAASAQVPPLVSGEQLQVEMHGSVVAERERSPVDGALGVVERMTLPDLVVTMWRYGQAERGEPRSKIEERVRAEARGRETRMVIHAPGRSQLVVLGDHPAQIETGTVYRVMSSRPALRLDDERVDLLLVFEEEIDRDRASVEIVRETADR